jgi:hypothetical protein
MYDEEDVPNAKRMCAIEEEVPVPQGPTITVPSEEKVPPEEEEIPVPAIAVSPEEEEVPAPLVTVPPEGRGCLVSVDC